MKAVLRYRRLPKPLGQWRYPLWFYIAISVDGPHDPLLCWQMPEFVLGRCEPAAVTGDLHIRPRQHVMPRCMRCHVYCRDEMYWVCVGPSDPADTVTYWLTARLRERFIDHLNDVVFPSLKQWVDAHKESKQEAK